MSESSPEPVPPPEERNIRIHLSDQATLQAVRVDGEFHILVGDDVEIRGVTPDRMAELVGSVMDIYLPADMASRLLAAWRGRRRGREKAPVEFPEAPHSPEKSPPRDDQPEEGDEPRAP